MRQASVVAEREHREYRIQQRAQSERGTGKHGQWQRISTHDSMVGVPDPEKERTFSTSLLHTSLCMTIDPVTHKPTPMTHHIQIASPLPGQPHLVVALEPAMKTWGTEWGLRDKPASPRGDLNTSMGVDMSPRRADVSPRRGGRREGNGNCGGDASSPRRGSNTSSFASSPLKPASVRAADEAAAASSAVTAEAGAGAAQLDFNSMVSGNESEIRMVEEDDDEEVEGSLRIDPFLIRREEREEREERQRRSEKGEVGGRKGTTFGSVAMNSSRMERTTKSWVERQQLIVATRGGGGGSGGSGGGGGAGQHYTLQEEREVMAAESERKEWLNEERKRRKVANAAVRMADKHRKEKEESENDALELNSMINSLPELFRNRVMVQVTKHRERATNVAEQLKGTSTSKMRQHQIKQMKEKKKKQAIPMTTELFHEGGFNAHIERCRGSRLEKKMLQKKATSTSGTWAPGHTIVQPFSFEARTTKVSFCVGVGVCVRLCWCSLLFVVCP